MRYYYHTQTRKLRKRTNSGRKKNRHSTLLVIECVESILFSVLIDSTDESSNYNNNNSNNSSGSSNRTSKLKKKHQLHSHLYCSWNDGRSYGAVVCCYEVNTYTLSICTYTCTLKKVAVYIAMYDKHECSSAINICSINTQHAAPGNTHDYSIFTLTRSLQVSLSFSLAPILRSSHSCSRAVVCCE